MPQLCSRFYISTVLSDAFTDSTQRVWLQGGYLSVYPSRYDLIQGHFDVGTAHESKFMCSRYKNCLVPKATNDKLSSTKRVLLGGHQPSHHPRPDAHQTWRTGAIGSLLVIDSLGQKGQEQCEPKSINDSPDQNAKCNLNLCLSLIPIRHECQVAGPEAGWVWIQSWVDRAKPVQCQLIYVCLKDQKSSGMRAHVRWPHCPRGTQPPKCTGSNHPFLKICKGIWTENELKKNEVRFQPPLGSYNINQDTQIEDQVHTQVNKFKYLGSTVFNNNRRCRTRYTNVKCFQGFWQVEEMSLVKQKSLNKN